MMTSFTKSDRGVFVCGPLCPDMIDRVIDLASDCGFRGIHHGDAIQYLNDMTDGSVYFCFDEDRNFVLADAPLN